MKTTQRTFPLAGLVLLLLFPAQAQITPPPHHAPASHIVVPQTRVLASPRPAAGPIPGPAQTVQIVEIVAAIDILEQVATTTLDIVLTNAGSSRLQAEMVVPVPGGALLRGFTFQGAGAEPTARLLPKEEARQLYDAIVAKTLDPALLEFIGYNLVRSSVFPVEPRAGQKVRLTYEHLLPADGGRIDYVLPRSESVDYNVPWKITIKIKSQTPIATVYSPSHKLETARPNENNVTARIAAEAATEPGSFRLSYLLQKDGLSASLLAYPDPKAGGGYFLVVAAAPVKAPEITNGAALKREVTLVIDRSGSMQGEKLEQVREAALQVLEGLEDGEAFHIIIYNETVESFTPAPVVKSRETMQAARAYLKGLRVRGGTNLHDALVEALRQKPMEGFLPIVLFLTDGLPTVGQTSEAAIRQVAAKGNPHERRIFTFGVGVDLNTPLLDRIARETRATATFVLPREDVEVKVAQVFKRLAGPVLASPKLKILSADGKAAPGRVRDLTPSQLPDLFEGDQLVLLGQYLGEEPLTFVLEGNYFGEDRAFPFAFGFEKATTKNAFVPRLWASRKIALLTDAIRDLGADAGLGMAAPPASNPKLKELVDEIVRLSKEFGILTEYTAFFAEEGTDLSQPVFLIDEATKQFTEKAIQIRTGYGSVNQDFNNRLQRAQVCVNARNSFLDDQMNRVSIRTVQQVNDRAFYKRGNRWVDSQLVEQAGAAPSRVVVVGSEEFRQLAHRLAAQDRQGCIALRGEILLQVDNETVLIQ